KQAKPGLLTSDLNGELAVYDGEKDAVHILNPTAKLIYEMAAAGRGVEEIVAAVREKFEAGSESNVAGDVRRLIAELVRKDILNRRDP
ncbi:MAG: PqqD family protein, partial [Acidobacteriota bacterium]|nr:PqqD family protein [Acidobacteriota bacterium]